ncbi:Guanine nucleotide-binding protein alpha-2 subunit [Blastocladiella emersonii ATCC 22665]|nr:Guanine nucleotide-binding protein alpha-2 subunit [Blastocladiella emersonii ATCC 22665]
MATIVKQIKILHQRGFTPAELAAYRPAVLANVADALVALARALGVTDLRPVYAANQAALARVVSAASAGELADLPDLAAVVDALWRDPIMAEVHARASDFFNNIHRITKPGYVPTEADVLRARVKTTGFTETRFSMGPVQVHLIDVGGQRSERRKWLPHFSGVTCVLFCAALSEYDQLLAEDPATNRLAESLVLFESVVASPWFADASVLLFLNKIDVFRAKLARVPLRKYLPEYTGSDTDVGRAVRFLLGKFVAVNRAQRALRMYPHLVCATDTGNIRLVFAAIKDTILQNSLREAGIQ